MSNLKVAKSSSGSPGPLFVLCYSGGFIAGDKNQFMETARALCGLFGATLVSIGYRLAREHPWPQSQLDGIDSVKRIAENATLSLLGADPSKGFIIGCGPRSHLIAIVSGRQARSSVNALVALCSSHHEGERLVRRNTEPTTSLMARTTQIQRKRRTS